MAESNRIQIVSEYTDLSSAKIKQGFKKSEKSANEFSIAVEKMRKSMLRSARTSRKEMKTALDSMSAGMKKTVVNTGKAEKSIGRMRVATAGLRRTIGMVRNWMLLWFFVFNPIIKKFKELTGAMQKQEDAIARLNIAMQGQGTFTEHTSKKLKEQAAAFQKVTRYGDEAIMEVMQKLTSLGGVLPSQLKKVTQATLDLAASQKMELSTATDLVAKAATGYTGTLSRYGIQISNSVPASKKLAAVLDEMNAKGWGGAAQRDIETYSGQVAQVGNQFGDVKEKLGKLLIRTLRLKDIVLPFYDQLLERANKWLSGGGDEKSALTKDLELQVKIYDRLIRRQVFIATTMKKRGNEKAYQIEAEKLKLMRIRRDEYNNSLNETMLKSIDLEKIVVAAADAEARRLEAAHLAQKERRAVETQMGDATLSLQKNLATAAMKSWEDSFFNIMHGKFESLKDVVISFGDTVLRMLIKLGIQKAITKIGGSAWAELFGMGKGAHSGGYIMSGMSASYGAAPAMAAASRQKFHSGGEVPATLLAGEGVLSKRGMNSLGGVNNLNRLNRGEGGGGNTTNNYYNINTIDERSFRDRLEQHGDIYSGAISSDLPANREVRRSIQRYGR